MPARCALIVVCTALYLPLVLDHPTQTEAELQQGTYDTPMKTLNGATVLANSVHYLNYFQVYQPTSASCGPLSSGNDNRNNCWNNFFGTHYFENMPG